MITGKSRLYSLNLPFIFGIIKKNSLKIKQDNITLDRNNPFKSYCPQEKNMNIYVCDDDAFERKTTVDLLDQIGRAHV